MHILLLQKISLTGLLACQVQAQQITITNIPQGSTVCANAAQTATFSTVVAYPTGDQVIPAGDFWNQTGAVWTFATDTQNILFSDLGFEVGPDGAGAADSSAIKLGPSSKAWTLSVPTSASNVSIIWVAATTAASSATAVETGATWTAGACSLSTFTDHAVTCAGSTKQPAATTGERVCACPSSILLEVPSGGTNTANPCAGYTSNQGDLEIVTNACPTTTSGSKLKRWDDGKYPAMQPRTPEVTKAPLPVRRQGTKFRRASAGESYSLTISGAIPCGSNTAVYNNPSTASPTSGASPTQATLCLQGDINANAAAYSQYNVNSFISSAFVSAASANGQAATDPSVDAGSILAQKAGFKPTDKPSYLALASKVACSAIPDASGGATVVVQEYLAYNSLVNLNNFFYYIITELLNGANNGLGISSTLATAFYTDSPPDPTWEQILGAIGPLLGILSAGLGGVGATIPSALTGVFSSIFGEASGIGNLNTQPVEDQRFTEAGGIGNLTQLYLQKMYPAFETAYEKLIGNASASGWTSSEAGNSPIMGDGAWLDFTPDDSFGNAMLDNTAIIVTTRMINYLWNASNTFVIYVPYGPVTLPSGSSGTVSADDCNKYKSDPWLNCNAPGPGMARIFNPTNTKAMASTSSDAPKGATGSGVKIGISNPVLFDPKLAAAGSVNSWKTGDFWYNVDSTYPNLAKSGTFSSADALAIKNIKIGQDTAGFFALPVCRVTDLRSFPPANFGSGKFENDMCMCAEKGATGGKDTSLLFFNNVNKQIQDYVSPLSGTVGSSECPVNV